MPASPLAAFASGFLAGGIALGAVVAHARMMDLNGYAGGVPPGNGASLFCVTATSTIRAVRGTTREVSVGAPNNTASHGVEMRCPG